VDGGRVAGFALLDGTGSDTGSRLMNHLRELFIFSAKERRYYKLSILPMLTFVAVMAFSAVTVKHFREEWAFAALALIALLPVVPILWTVKLYLDFFQACDEWERLIEVYGICIGVLLVGMVYFAIGLLGLMQLITLDGTLVAYLMLPAVSLAYVLGKIVGRWRHG
jgi:hypothetical protein